MIVLGKGSFQGEFLYGLCAKSWFQSSFVSFLFPPHLHLAVAAVKGKRPWLNRAPTKQQCHCPARCPPATPIAEVPLMLKGAGLTQCMTFLLLHIVLMLLSFAVEGKREKQQMKWIWKLYPVGVSSCRGGPSSDFASSHLHLKVVVLIKVAEVGDNFYGCRWQWQALPENDRSVMSALPSAPCCRWQPLCWHFGFYSSVYPWGNGQSCSLLQCAGVRSAPHPLVPSVKGFLLINPVFLI